MNDPRVIPVVVVGARGRMGKTLLRTIMESDDLSVAAAVDRSGGPGTGLDAGQLAGLTDTGIRVTDQLEPRRGQVVVDFSLPEATNVNLERCVAAGAPLVLGTTGISEETETLIEEASEHIPIVAAANYSVGVTLLIQLSAIAAKALGPGWDAEVFELHHRHKRDAPSGTALRIGQAVASATSRDFADVVVPHRTGTNRPRRDDDIGVISARGGDSIGEHTLMLLGDEERLELTHRAGNRAIFARGALRAARWTFGREPGLYDMVDVLGLDDATIREDMVPSAND
ncbi:MAG: 4-hydroxy-tetrahydrodipicolinate reductase [Myxococcales bacterium FL481]|nr:MAG: 4-hydroxy-tetrahydrodipicolinate reductase [Myxococcales bacterium FL481]